MFSQIWGRITGADKGDDFPDQQASFLGRLGDYTIVYPYGMYCDLPNDVWLRRLDKGKAIPMTSSRPDSSRGEIIIFHPVTGDKVHFKNGSIIDVVAGSAVNVTAPIVTVNATTVNLNADVNIVGNMDITGTVTNNGKDIGDTHGHAQDNDSGGNTEQNINGVL